MRIEIESKEGRIIMFEADVVVFLRYCIDPKSTPWTCSTPSSKGTP